MLPLGLLARPARHLFFTGKGGVGKTALSCAVAIALADRGRRVLLVSTDPASNLDEMLGVALGGAPRDVPGVAGLQALNIDPADAADRYRARVLAPYADRPAAERAEMREQLSGACTTEIAAFDQFAGLVGESDVGGACDHIVFDTAPTGHTLRLLALPQAWSTFLDSNPRGASCIGPHSGLTLRRERYAQAFAALADPTQTTFVLVARPDAAALREAARTADELRALGLGNQRLVVNAVFRATARDDVTALAFEARGARALDDLPPVLRALPRDALPLRGFDMVGLPALRALLSEVDPPAPAPTAPTDPTAPTPTTAETAPPTTPTTPTTTTQTLSQTLSQTLTLGALLQQLDVHDHLLLLVMGKGGVGKTTIAAALAVALARRGTDVHLSTTDPAAHVAGTVAGVVDHLEVSRIDPVAEVAAYTAKVLARRGAGLDDAGRALLVEDLRSPCTEEVAVFHAFSRLVSEAGRRVVVLDTAPTGHTLLLLDATGAYHRDVTRDLVKLGPDTLRTPLMRLQDPAFTRVVIVTLAETTPVTEAAALQAELRRAGIEPWAWVINASLAATGTVDPVLRARVAHEHVEIERVRRDHATRVALVPWVSTPPVGAAGLLALIDPPPPQARPRAG